MPRYRISGIATASKVLGYVDAATKEEAIDKAWQDDEIGGESHISLCHSCADEVEIGDVYDLQADEAEEEE